MSARTGAACPITPRLPAALLALPLKRDDVLALVGIVAGGLLLASRRLPFLGLLHVGLNLCGLHAREPLQRFVERHVEMQRPLVGLLLVVAHAISAL